MRIRIRAWVGLLVTMAATIAMTGLLSSPAQALVTRCAASDNVNPGATVCFYPHDELLVVCDTAADGHHASAAYRGSYDSGWTEAPAYGGNGTCETFDFDMPEYTYIAFHAVVMEGPYIVRWGDCPNGAWVSAEDDGHYGADCPPFDGF